MISPLVAGGAALAAIAGTAELVSEPPEEGVAGGSGSAVALASGRATDLGMADGPTSGIALIRGVMDSAAAGAAVVASTAEG